MILEYECKTKQEYIEMQISDYILKLSDAYKEKFPDEDELIESHIESSVAIYGKNVFGEAPLQRLEKVRKMYSPKMLSSIGINIKKL